MRSDDVSPWDDGNQDSAGGRLKCMRITRTLTAAAMAVGLLGACGGGDDGGNGGGSTTVPPIELDGHTFLSHTVTVAGRDRPLVGSTRITLTFGDGTVGASAGCNSMSGPYSIDNGVLKVGDLETTEIGCEKDLQAQDEWLAGVLKGAPSVRLSDAELTLTAGETIIALVDRKVAEPDASLTGTRWTLESIIQGDVASSIPAGVESTFELSEHGTVAVQFGCNSGGGPAEVGDATITFGAIGRTVMACDDPAMQVEDSVAAVLTGEVTYVIDADRLSLRNGDGGLDWRAAG